MQIVAYRDDVVVLEPESIELDARLRVSDEHLSGEVRLPDGRRIAFDGWLGLIGAVESACAASCVGGQSADEAGA